MATDIGTGTTIAASGAGATFATGIKVLGLAFTDTFNRNTHDMSSMGTTGGRIKTIDDTYDPGGVDVTILFDPAIVPFATSATAVTWTITFPGAETMIADGWVTNYPPNAQFEERMEMTFHIEFTGSITGTLMT